MKPGPAISALRTPAAARSSRLHEILRDLSRSTAERTGQRHREIAREVAMLRIPRPLEHDLHARIHAHRLQHAGKLPLQLLDRHDYSLFPTDPEVLEELLDEVLDVEAAGAAGVEEAGFESPLPPSAFAAFR
jgi:hypothetical protein